jgi:glycosyltransferase involved in cell wall biosynthesis
MLAQELARDHAVTVLALRWPDQSGELPGLDLRTVPAPSGAPARLRDRVDAVARSRPVGWDRLVRCMAPALTAVLAEGAVDVVHVVPDDLAGLAPLLDGHPAVVAPLDARHLNIRAQADAASGLTRRWREHQTRAVRHELATALRPYGAAVFVTGEDAREVARLDPQVRTEVIPLAIDAAAFERPADVEPRDPTQVLFTGVLSTPANEHAARRLAVDVMPLVRAEVPGARLSLVGRAPSAAVRHLQGPGVEVVADAPDLRPWLWGAGAFACPMAHGTGSKNKLLEAMAAGAAAVATPLACRGLAVRDGEHLLVAGTDRELAAGLVAVLRDDGRRARLAAAARALVAADHAPGVIAARYVSLYGDVIAR